MDKENNLIIQAVFNPDLAIEHTIKESENLIWYLQMIKAHGFFGAKEFLESAVNCSNKISNLVAIISFLGQANMEDKKEG